MMRCRRSREELLAMGLTEEEVDLLMAEEAVRWKRAANETKMVRRVVSAKTETAFESGVGCFMSIVYAGLLCLGALCAWPIALPGIVLRYLWLKWQLDAKKSAGKKVEAADEEEVGRWKAFAWIAGIVFVFIIVANL